MRTGVRRRIDALALAGAVLVVGGVAAVGAAVGDGERITGMWAGAELGGDGDARIIEAIDYDFGTEARHGIFRDVPGLQPDAPVSVSSATAPDNVALSGSSLQTRIRIGDPARTVTGRHRYTIGYPLGGVAPDGRLAWDAVGTSWPVEVAGVEIHAVAPFELLDARCVQGATGADDPCGVTQPEPGHLVARVDALSPAEGVTLFATAGRQLAATPALPAPPSGRPSDPGTGVLLPGLLAAAVAGVAAAPTSRMVRLAGRERVAAGGSADAAWGGTGGEIRIDADRLASLATVEFVPPSELTPAQGGVVLAEAVRKEHKVAWLIGAAIDGYVDLQGNRATVTLVRLPRRDGSTAYTLDLAFAGRERLPLGSYDERFAEAWRAVGSELAAWQRSCGLWDPAGERRRILAWVLGGVAAVAGLVVAGVGGAAANRWGAAWLVLVALGALLAGAGAAVAVRAWELRVRTAAGSGLWLRVESFRRFLAASEAHHADEAAKRGVLREYAAWAVAVGEIDRWSRAVAASGAARDPAAVHYTAIAPALYTATSATSTEPSKGDGGGGGGGSVGAGAGGGGGGSW
ncbi:MAG TPA: DUF2207 domain-containing protein [Actinomycetota bacterium]|nr:DUF2207 domain-containing protein [Actinomycetota bacterium]